MLVITGVPGRHTLSANPKTGPMAQAWIMGNLYPPNDSRSQDSACGACPLRPDMKEGGGCYVVLSHAPTIIYHTYAVGEMEDAGKLKLPLGLRMGAYGDPTQLPLSIWLDLKKLAAFHTGYTHHWRTVDSTDWSFLMASVQTIEEAQSAWDLGWRTFRTVLKMEDTSSNEIVCPNFKNPGRQCYSCRLCDGTHANITIPIHGSRKKRMQDVILDQQIREAEET